MISIILLTSALAAPPAVAEISPSRFGEVNRPLTLEDVREAYLSALQKSARRANPEPADVVPALTRVYNDLETVEGLSHAERSRMQSSVEARLKQLRDKLIRELLRNKKIADRKKRRSPRSKTKKPVDEKAEMLAGGGANAQAIKLIDLIQNTIAPESWQAAGGRGSIYYFDLLKVLVVRQTGEVHHQLGGVLEQLRP